MKHLLCTAALAIALIASAPVSGQDCCGKSACGAVGIICPKDGKCEGACRKICDRVGDTYKALRTRVGEIMSKDCGMKCEHCAGECKADGCTTCESLKTKVYAPLLKEKATARMKELDKDVKHSVKSEDGKTTTEVACTFLKGDTCKVCVNEMADASWVKIKEMFAKAEKK